MISDLARKWWPVLLALVVGWLLGGWVLPVPASRAGVSVRVDADSFIAVEGRQVWIYDAKAARWVALPPVPAK